MLSQSSPISRLALLRRVPFRAQALAVCAAAIVAIAVLIAAWHSPLAHADGNAPARSQTPTPVPDDSGATIQAHAQRILRILADRDANNWVRYWQARYACDASPADQDAALIPPRSRALLALTDALCAQLDALLGVNLAAYQPRGEERSVGLMLNEPGAAMGYTLFTGSRNGDVFPAGSAGQSSAYLAYRHCAQPRETAG